MADVNLTALFPQITLRDRTGASTTFAEGPNGATIIATITSTGVYTIVVADESTGSNAGARNDAAHGSRGMLSRGSASVRHRNSAPLSMHGDDVFTCLRLASAAPALLLALFAAAPTGATPPVTSGLQAQFVADDVVPTAGFVETWTERLGIRRRRSQESARALERLRGDTSRAA